MKTEYKLWQSWRGHDLTIIDKRKKVWCRIDKRSGILIDHGHIAQPVWYHLT